MSSKFEERKQKSRSQNAKPKACVSKANSLIFFGSIHSLIWLIMYLLLGWLGVMFGFLVNCVMDSGLLLIWIWQDKKQHHQTVALPKKELLE